MSGPGSSPPANEDFQNPTDLNPKLPHGHLVSPLLYHLAHNSQNILDKRLIYLFIFLDNASTASGPADPSS